jgi:hypothetical protein
MPRLTVVAREVDPNEGALVLFETPGPGAWPGSGLRRWQVLKVIRNDRIATYKRDLGPAEWFGHDYVNLPGGEVDEKTGRGRMWHTVGELQRLADELRVRDHKAWAEEKGFDLIEGSPEDWENGYHEERERRERKASGIKTFGMRKGGA